MNFNRYKLRIKSLIYSLNEKFNEVEEIFLEDEVCSI